MQYSRITNIVILFGTVIPFSQRFTVAQLTFNSSASSFCEILRSLRVDEIMQQNIFIAFTVIATVPCILVYLVLQKHFNRGLMSGAVKG